MTTLGPYELNSIITGDARELSKAIPDNSVDLIFTDPVYDRIEDYEWLAKTATRVLKDEGNLLAYCAHVNMDIVIQSLSEYLSFRWLLIQQKNGVSGAMFGHKIYCNYIPLLWYSPSNGKPYIWGQDLIRTQPQGKSVNFKWSKNPQGLRKWLEYFTIADSILFDFNCGGGAIPAVCKQLNRQYLAFEIDPATADLARQRVANTQPPLPIVYPEQMELSYDHP